MKQAFLGQNLEVVSLEVFFALSSKICQNTECRQRWGQRGRG